MSARNVTAQNVPPNWDVRRLKSICSLAYGDSLPDAERSNGEIPVYGSNGKIGTHVVSNTDGPSIVIGRKGSFGKVHFSEQPAFAIDTTYFVDRNYTQADLHWLFYLLASLGLDTVSRDSAIPGLNRDDAYRMACPYPPPEEQAAIVRYLDRADELINRYISAKERLIALLEEQRQAFIHQAVTSGLDPNVPTKSSGIPWVGDVPQNWRVASLRYVTECLDGARKPVSRELRANMQGAVPYWGANSIIDHVNDWIFDEQLVLIGEDGAPFYDPTRDVSFFADGKIWPNNHIHVLRCKTLTSPRFLPHVLNCVDYTDFISGSTRDKLTQQSMGNIPVQLPPIAEQDVIAEFLTSRITHTSKSISYANRQIGLVNEYRTHLIADVVTGQIDVRDAAVELHV